MITIDQLIHSPTAHRHGIDNTPPEAARNMLAILTHHVLEPIEAIAEKPLRIVSGYRTVALNRLMQGRRHSHHIIGCAADITTGNRRANRRLYRQLTTMATEGHLRCSELTLESEARWIHVAYVPSMLEKKNPPHPASQKAGTGTGFRLARAKN